MHRSLGVSSPNAVLPIEARQAAWDALWRRLLAEPPRDDDPEPPPPEVPCGMRNGEAPADGPTQAPALQKEDVCPDQVSRERGAERARPSRAAFILAPPSDAAGTGHWASATTHTD
jgi:hypothetical protein